MWRSFDPKKFRSKLLTNTLLLASGSIHFSHAQIATEIPIAERDPNGQSSVALHFAARRARQIDPARQLDWRPTVSGGHRTPVGLQFDAACLQIGARMGMSEQDWRHNLDLATNSAFAQIVPGCYQRYPLLSPYIGSYVSNLRRNLVTCSSDPNACAPFLRGGCADVFGSFNALGPSIIADNDANFWTSSPTQGSLLADFIVHENLHFTGANNREDHGQVEARIPTDQTMCEDNVASDRVVMVESLCTGRPAGSSNLPAARILSQRIQRCGIARGCIDLFTVNGNNLISRRRNLNSINLDQDVARQLCLQIEDDGRCYSERNSHRLEWIRANPNLNALRASLRNILQPIGNQFAIHHRGQIPLALLHALSPELHRQLRSVQNTLCFQALFSTDSIESISLRSPPIHLPNEILLSEFPYNVEELRLYFINLETVLRQKLNSEAACAQHDTRSAIEVLAYAWSQAISPWLVSAFHFANSLESPSDVFNLIHFRPSAADHTLFRYSLSQRVQNQIRFQHPDSPEFDCVAAGIGSFRATQTAARVLKNFPSTTLSTGSCDVENAKSLSQISRK